LPFEVEGHAGSVVVTLKPAPRGTGLAIGDIAKSVLRMAGVKDAWGFTKGHTKTTINNSIAAFEALRKTSQVRVTEEQKSRLQIVSGPVQIHFAQTAADMPPEEAPGEEGAERGEQKGAE
jgi:small subunit ribosomal protein S5